MSNMKIYQGNLIEKEANLIYDAYIQESTLRTMQLSLITLSSGQRRVKSRADPWMGSLAAVVVRSSTSYGKDTVTALVVCCYIVQL